MSSSLPPVVSNSDRTSMNADETLSSEAKSVNPSSNNMPVVGHTLLGSSKLNDMYEGAKGVGVKYASAAAKMAECERLKHSKAPPTFIPESDTAGLVQGSRGTEPTLNERLEEEARK